MSGETHAVDHGVRGPALAGADRLEALAGSSQLGARIDVFALLNDARRLGGDNEMERHHNLRAAILHHALQATLDIAGGRRLADELVALFEHHGLLRPAPDVSEAAMAADLSAREAHVLECLTRGLPNKVIAQEMGITDATVKVHIKSLLNKIGARNRTQAAMWAVQHGYAGSNRGQPQESSEDGKATEGRGEEPGREG